jgi:hypothetical protein
MPLVINQIITKHIIILKIRRMINQLKKSITSDNLTRDSHFDMAIRSLLSKT